MACKNKLHIVFCGTHTVCAMLTECENSSHHYLPSVQCPLPLNKKWQIHMQNVIIKQFHISKRYNALI